MRGCRPLSDAEEELVRKTFGGRYAVRDRALFVLGVKTGFRISELLSVTVGDVWRQGAALHVLSVARQSMKGKREGRTMALHEKARAAIEAWVSVMPHPWDEHTPLFRSQKGGALTRVQAWEVLRQAYDANGLEGKLGTHSLRKTFAKRIYDHERDARTVQKALGHQHLGTTEKYLEFMTDEQIFAIVRGL